ncbi:MULTISPECIES: hypothetical protein [unclassified Streptomyces]|uniref:hypothetical protein n=1 Tax=unclassified Streptomyces TaxID=2593676 RepID=UPI0013196942|nr:hypothetical protein [Streptomyces sp. GS7]QHC24339.1 hypothetical protein GR130_26125 [Streptomyces sp. GS7]
MSTQAKVAIGGVVVGVILLSLLPFWAAVLVMVGIPAIAYLTLDPSQRRRLRHAGRKQIDR